MTNVNPEWSTHQKEQFGEQKYVTADLLRSFGQNEYYLYLLAKALDKGLPANVRNYFDIITYFDKDNSYGASINGEYLQFDDNLEERHFYDFEDLSGIDLAKTTADIIGYEQEDAYGNKTAIKQVQLSKQTVTNVDKSTRNYSPWTVRDGQGNIISDDFTVNEFWYISWDNARPWEVRPTWIQNPWSGEIPNIARAQTFTAKETGRLTKLTLALRESIHGTPQEPLTVEIRRVERKDGVDTPMAPIPGAILASEQVSWNGAESPDIYTIDFKAPCHVVEGEKYAFVVLARPTVHPTHSYHIGGWSKSCDSELYPDGDAFTSFNNSFTWMRYSKEEPNRPYHAGNKPVEDFAFIATIESESSSYTQNTDEYLYLKPIISAPVNSVEINANDDIADSRTTIQYQVSNDGETWVNVPATGVVNFDNARRTTFVRAKLRSSINDTPRISSMNVILRTDASSEFYIRTKAYTPKLTGILGAATWSRIYCPIITEPATTVTGEILSKKEIKEQFIIIEPEDLVDYLWIEELKKDEIAIRRDPEQYLEDHPSALTILKNYNIYVTGEFMTPIEFFNSPAYPNRQCVLNTPTRTANEHYNEWYDFEIDYENDVLEFYEPEDVPKGVLDVYFNPVILKNISPVELGRRDTNLEDNKEWDEEGLRIDAMSEKFIVDDNIIENRRINLKLPPLDPIRRLTINDVELMQDRDFRIDMRNRQIEFIVSDNVEQSEILHLNDVIEVDYTPNIEDDSLTLAFFGKRTNLMKNAKIQSYSIDYKV